MIGKLFIISAPSGAGKTSLARALIADSGNCKMSVSHTTRERRAEEVDGEDYFFVDEQTFLSMTDEGVFLEHAKVYGNYYGTSKLAVDNMLKLGVNVLLDIDWQGARLVREQMPGAISIAILPPSVAELERRLRGRGSDSDDVIDGRMEQAFDEMAHCNEADFIVLNDDFNQALNDLSLIIADESDRIRDLKLDVNTLLVRTT